MSSEKTEGLIIRLADFSESSRVVTFFTRSFGRISALAKGAKRLKGPFESALDLLTTSQIVFLRKSSSSLDLLTEAKLVRRFRPNEKSLMSLYGGYYIAELLSELTVDYDPQPDLYSAACNALQSLEGAESPQQNLVQFEVRLLHETGQLAEFDQCHVCGTPTTGGKIFAFWVSQGGLLCEGCRRQDFSSQKVSSGSIAILNAMAGRLASSEVVEQFPVVQTAPYEDGDFARHIQASPQQILEIHCITVAAITHLIGKRPKTLRYLQF